MYPTVEIKKKEIFHKNNFIKLQIENPKLKSKHANNFEINNLLHP